MLNGNAFDTDVLVVGTGPMGSATALALATYGIRVHLVNRWNWLSDTPRAHITNQRTVEVLRDLGVEQEAAQSATPWELMGDTLFTTSLSGPEIARLRTWGTGDDRIGDYIKGSPCPMLDIPQMYLEPVLFKNAADRGATASFNTEYLSHTQDADGVTAQLQDLLTGRTYSMRARYLVGADGARSKIVDELGLELDGHHARAGTVYVLFEADLSRYVEHRPSILNWIVTSSADFGEIGMGLLRAVRPWHTWIAGWGYDLAAGEPDRSEDTVLAKVRALVGDPGLEIKVRSTSTWLVNQAVARSYSKGRVFCGGDAVHRHPPSSGLGSNTSIQDGFNLAWKLAYVICGYADESLLDSYSLERQPVGAQIVARANQSRLDYTPFNACLRVDGHTDPLSAGLTRFHDPGPAGAEVREKLRKAMELKNFEFNAHGIELNHRYESGAVIADSEAGPETFEKDSQLFLKATTRPGAKIPHAWLIDRTGRRISTLDITGSGRFTLITGVAGQAWARAVELLDRPYLTTVITGATDTADLYFDWARLREVHEAGAILVRPDGYVAWRHAAPVWDEGTAAKELRCAIDSVLGNRVVDSAHATTPDRVTDVVAL
ncbi:FAD-dependent monooxygenase [Nocardia sp. NPDC052112]|uniref:FAD-dependent oxidoreductase n=1 Tax=Nocardia sp. NPDC052112 TaxID=3155646 RepID=UPI0034192EB3